MNDWEIYSEPSRKTCQLMQQAVGMQSIGRLASIAYHLMQSAHVPGDVVEFGCNEGRTAALMASLTRKPLWLYDSFTGFPTPNPQDSITPEARREMRGTEAKLNASATLEYFKSHGLPKPTITSKFFSQVAKEELPEAIAFAHLDGDLYASIRDSLRLVYPRLSPGAVCVVDDYYKADYPGVAKAIADYQTEARCRITLHKVLDAFGERAHHVVFYKPLAASVTH